MLKLIVALMFVVLSACGGSVDPGQQQSYCPTQEFTRSDGAPTSTVKRSRDQICDQCFEAGLGLGQCTDGRALWVGCAYEPPAADCVAIGFDGQFCCNAVVQ